VLRGSGARGLAGLFAPSEIVRPFLELSRESIARDAVAHGLRWIEDPSNESRVHLRNRIRHELLPALLDVRPELGDALIDLGRRAAVIRSTFDRIAATMVIAPGAHDSLIVATDLLRDYDPEVLRALWPSIAARGAIVLDRRGTAGLARFTKEAATGDLMQLSGGLEVVRRRDAIVLRRSRTATPDAATLEDGLEWGRWRFAARLPVPDVNRSGNAWVATLPAAQQLVVRAWRDGDRMHGAGDASPRRVKRFLRDAGLVGPERQGWPVVVCGEEVVWIPGVRRSDAATVRSGRPEAVYVCERTDS
jgi:tRNA(Ile)-lysidine synthase